MTDQTKLIIGIIGGAIPALFSLLIWYLNHKEKTKEARETERLSARLDLIKKIKDMSDFTDDQAKRRDELINLEFNRVTQFLQPPVLTIHEEKKLEAFQSISKFRRLFLFFRPTSLAIGVLQFIYFYLILVWVVLILVCVSLISEGTLDNTTALGFFVLFMFVSILCFVVHGGAIRLQTKSHKRE